MTGFILGAAATLAVGVITLWARAHPDDAKALVAKVAGLFRKS